MNTGEEASAADLIAAMHDASGRDLTELGRRVADRLDREKSLRDNRIDELRNRARRLDRAVADLTAATSGTELLRRACTALADICAAERVVASFVESETAVPVATYGTHAGSEAPPAYALLPGSPESAVLVPGSAPVIGRSAGALRHLFPDGCTITAAGVGETTVVLIHISGTLAAAQHDSATLLVEVLGGCLQRLGLATRRARQLDLLRSSGIARENRDPAPAGIEPVPAAPPGMEPLTEREREVLRLILRGSSNTAIATELVITVDTVKSHVKRILRKLGATNRSELIARHSAAGLTRRSIAPPSR
ncbi:helix-turn-helix transcriptional regulator [Nocardia sp. alder85J]|uniref:helix-turn-helix transcriptional regulator n=1 Tax=Nocardia sp. alder85J TaxID=2862949 RepID=UPI001CD70CFA|nr:helix-turn-helix transcriptional regulator [Nocardia sp. alder85J]MCX4096694.1 LuxR C-terminal-related transcriptional regulator [Nocardia sp. alder85J]